MRNLWISKDKSMSYKDFIDHEKNDVYSLGITII